MSTPAPATQEEARTAGIRAILVAALLFSLMSLLVKWVGRRISSLEIVFIRSVLTLAFSAILIHRAGVPFWGTHRRLLFLRGLFGSVALASFFYSVTQLPLAVATIIQFTNPILTALLAALVLGERATSRLWLAMALGLGGVLIITRPVGLLGAEALGSTGLPAGVVAIALGGALSTAAAYVLVRKLAPLEHELTIVFYFPLVAVPGTLLFLHDWTWPTALEWLGLLGIALTAQWGQIYLTRGFHRLMAARATVVLYSQIVFATLWGWLILGEQPGVVTAVGAAAILAGTALCVGDRTHETPAKPVPAD